MDNRRAHIVIPEKLAKEIDAIAGKRGRSSFFTHAAEKELQRLKQLKSLKVAVGSWQDENHPELKAGSSKWIRSLRAESEKRFKKQFSR